MSRVDDAMRTAMSGLARAARVAEGKALTWCDAVRRQAEQRRGVEAGDISVLEDREYGRALDVLAALETLRSIAEHVERTARGEDQEER